MAPEPEDDFKDEKNPIPLDEDDIALLKTYVRFSSPPICFQLPLFSLGFHFILFQFPVILAHGNTIICLMPVYYLYNLWS